MSFDWSIDGCCCKVPYEAWASVTGGDGSQISILNLTQDSGEPINSVDDFSFDDDYDAVYFGAIARGGNVFVLEHDAEPSPTELSVSCYNVNTGSLVWGQTSSTTLDTSNSTRGYSVFGNSPIPAGQVGSNYSCNETQLWVIDTKQLFESTGVTTETASPNTTSDRLDGSSAEWIPRMLSSHDFPRVAGYRVYLENMTNVSYDTTSGPDGGGNYQHYYDFDVDETIEYGVGDYDTSTGSMVSVSVEDDYTASRTAVSGYIQNTSPTPPADPTSPSELTAIASFPSYVLRIPFGLGEQQNFYFSTLGSSHYIGVFPFEDTDASTVHERIIIDGTRKYDWTDGSQNCGSVASVQDTRADASFAEALLTYFNHTDSKWYIEALEYDGTVVWSQEVQAPPSFDFPRVLSVNDTWALVRCKPLGESSDAYWMWKLNNDEKKKCQKSGGGNPDNLTGNIQRFDLVKSVSHPYGPPPETYT